MRYPALVVVVSFSIGGCSVLEDEVNKGFAQRERLTTVTFTTADVRVITQRNRKNSPNPIVCTEPSPDVAKALSAAAQLSGSVANKGSVAAGGASAEAVAALAGRSTALLGLRDGLYRACEAYANGAIGADAYALVLSRYGQLMTTLFLGQDVTGAAGTNAGPSVQSPTVMVNLSGSTGVPASPAANPAAGAPSPTGIQPASTTDNSAVAPVALTRMNEDYLNLAYNPDALVIACINYADPTRVSAPILPVDSTGVMPAATPAGNKYLNLVCPLLFNSTALKMLATTAGDLVKNKVLAPPVDPAAVASAAQSKSAPKTSPPSPTPSAAKPTNAQITEAQKKLAALCTNLKVDGKLGPLTTACVQEFQSNIKLTPSGDLDADTLKALGVK